MRKTIKLTVIFLSALVMMACGLGGYATQKVETQPTTPRATVEPSARAEASPTSVSPTSEESLPAQNIEPTNRVEKSPPTPTTDPLISAKNCLAKTWEIKGLNDYVLAAVPPELAEEYSLEYVSTSGAAYLSLSADEKIVLQAEDLVFLFNAQFSIFEVPVTVSIDGAATGIYSVDSTTLTIKDMDTSGLTASARAMNEDLIDPGQIINAIPFIRPPFNTATYACKGETLELELSGYPGDMPPLVFQAVK